MDGKPYKRIHVFWMSAIPADMTTSLAIATYCRRLVGAYGEIPPSALQFDYEGQLEGVLDTGR
jgi:hypothetical protein